MVVPLHPFRLELKRDGRNVCQLLIVDENRSLEETLPLVEIARLAKIIAAPVVDQNVQSVSAWCGVFDCE